MSCRVGRMPGRCLKVQLAFVALSLFALQVYRTEYTVATFGDHQSHGRVSKEVLRGKYGSPPKSSLGSSLCRKLD